MNRVQGESKCWEKSFELMPEQTGQGRGTCSQREGKRRRKGGNDPEYSGLTVTSSKLGDTSAMSHYIHTGNKDYQIEEQALPKQKNKGNKDYRIGEQALPKWDTKITLSGLQHLSCSQNKRRRM